MEYGWRNCRLRRIFMDKNKEPNKRCDRRTEKTVGSAHGTGAAE